MSIGLPVFNGERYLAATAGALLAQTFEDIELIICDNASTDGTERISRSLAASDPRVRYERNARNVGSARNYRRAFELARGEYFRWAASDDLSAPTSVARCVEVLDADPTVVLAYPKTMLIDADGASIRPYEDRLHLTAERPSERFRALIARIGLCNAIYGMMRSDALRRTGLLGNFIGSDVVFQAELVLQGKFWEIPEYLFARRFHPDASSSKSKAELHAFYNPGRRRRLFLREWRHLVELVRAVERAPVGWAERLRLRAYLLRQACAQRLELRQELVGLVRDLLPAPRFQPSR